MEIRKEYGRKKKQERKGIEEGTRKARNLENEGGYCSLHLKVRGYFKEGRFKKVDSLFSPRRYRFVLANI